MTPRGTRALVVAGVVAVHALLLLVWSGTRPPQHDESSPVRVQLRLLPWPAPIPARAQTLAPAAPVPTGPARVSPAVVRRSPRVPPALQTDLPPRDSEPVTAVAAPLPASAASAPPPVAALLDGAATRLAIRDAARQRGTAAQARDLVGPDVANDEQRLARGVARGAQGDCLKGEYVGGGMGLLSLPFLAAAALRDQCRR